MWWYGAVEFTERLWKIILKPLFGVTLGIVVSERRQRFHDFNRGNAKSRLSKLDVVVIIKRNWRSQNAWFNVGGIVRAFRRINVILPGDSDYHSSFVGLRWCGAMWQTLTTYCASTFILRINPRWRHKSKPVSRVQAAAKHNWLH